jgi:predicted secreted Zn-dependent protease
MLQPHFVKIRRETDANARIFWDTYLAAISA